MTIGESFVFKGRTVTVLDIERGPDGIEAVCITGKRGAAVWVRGAGVDEVLDARCRSLMAVLL